MTTKVKMSKRLRAWLSWSGLVAGFGILCAQQGQVGLGFMLVLTAWLSMDDDPL